MLESLKGREGFEERPSRMAAMPQGLCIRRLLRQRLLALDLKSHTYGRKFSILDVSKWAEGFFRGKPACQSASPAIADGTHAGLIWFGSQ